MSPRKRDVAIVNLSVAKIRDQASRFGCKARWVIALSVGQIPEVRVTGLELNAMRQPLGQSARQSVVVAAAAVRFDLHQPKVGILKEWAAGGVTRCIRGKLIRIALPAQLAAVTPVIRKTQGRAKPQIALNRQVPLIDLRILNERRPPAGRTAFLAARDSPETDMGTAAPA